MNFPEMHITDMDRIKILYNLFSENPEAYQIFQLVIDAIADFRECEIIDIPAGKLSS
jgi:hypothetical protein